MNIKDIMILIKDVKVNIEIIEKESGSSFGFYNKDYIPADFLTREIKEINVQYVDGKRILVIKF
jgi:hypothetical protein